MCHFVYKATLQTADASEYIGLTDNTFKTRYNNHTYSFRIEARQIANTLAAHVWKKIAQTYPKNQVRNYQKISRLHPRPTRMQTLPLRKVLYIVKEYINNPKSLNKRAGMRTKCVVHKYDILLDHVT